jgi:DNA-binding transcriptional LysR family regulator
MLDVTRLRVLVAVARHGSVTAAARALQYAQPSVSHHLSRLEAETGSQLLQRVGRGVRLTEAGQVLAERAEEILGRLDDAEAELATYTGLRAGRVRLAAFPSALGTFVPMAAAAFAAASPDIELRLTEAEPPDAVRLLRSGEIDVALTFAHRDRPAVEDGPQHGQTAEQPADDGLRRVTLLTEPVYLTPKDLPGDLLVDHRSRRWIAGCERCRTALVRACDAAGFSPDIAFTTDDYLAVQALVAAGLGVTTLPGLSLRAHRHPGVRVAELPTLARTVTAAVHGEPPDPPATAALLDHLVAAAADWAPAITPTGQPRRR